MNTTFTLDIIQLISIVLITILIVLAYNVYALKWSYNISKPHKWENAVEKGTLSKNLIKLESSYRDKVRFYTIWLQIERLKEGNIKGAFAELGVYKGETAQFIHEMDSNRTLHLFDTFDGFSENDLKQENSKDEKYSTSNFSDTSLQAVTRFVNGNEHVHFHKGYFPQSAESINEKQYAFIHLDADLFAPTFSALEYFYPKLSPGGVIIVHDYNHTWDGIPKAVDKFAATIPENFIAIADWQGSSMLIKNS